jgi:peroxiredoxin family protein
LRPSLGGRCYRLAPRVNWSGDLDKVWPVLILSSTAAASGLSCKVFVTFWGLLPFDKDHKRVVGENWMQRTLSVMQRPGIDHLKLSKMNFMGMGPWMMGVLRRRSYWHTVPQGRV